jgi:hypothetical protein
VVLSSSLPSFIMNYIFTGDALTQKSTNLLNAFNIYGSVHCENIPIYIQQDAMLHSLLYLETALHVSGSTSTHHQECKQMYLQQPVLFKPLLLHAAIMEELELVCVCCGLHLVGYIYWNTIKHSSNKSL